MTRKGAKQEEPLNQGDSCLEISPKNGSNSLDYASNFFSGENWVYALPRGQGKGLLSLRLLSLFPTVLIFTLLTPSAAAFALDFDKSNPEL